MSVIDCTASPPVDALRAAGVVGVVRYLSWWYYWAGIQHSYVNPKVIQKPEYDRLTTGGYTVVLNWEFDAQDWLGGASAGVAHAAEAVRQARALGYPEGSAIYGSCDFDMSRAQWDMAGRAYAAAFRDGIRAGGYLTGPYGPWDVLTWCRDELGMDRFWQAGMSTAFSGGRNANPWPGAHLRQRRTTTIGGLSVDVNDILSPDYAGGDVNVWTDQSQQLPDGEVPYAYLVRILEENILTQVRDANTKVGTLSAAVADVKTALATIGAPTEEQVNAAVAAALPPALAQLGLTAEGIAKAVNDDAARRLES